MSLIKKNSWKKFLVFVFSGLIYLIALLIVIPNIPEISAYDAYDLDPGTIDAPAFPPPVVPCLENGPKGIRNPEFHSLRPYQASPCGDAPKAYFCNNDYTILEPINQKWDPNWCWYGSVGGGPSGAGTGPGGGGNSGGDSYFCEMKPNAVVSGVDNRQIDVYIIGGSDGRDYAISLNKVKYPIVGNTQNVINSQSANDEFASEQKLNQYVNWYLQGVVEKAEYGDRLPGDVETLAGPVKKLLPIDYLNYRRLGVLHDAGVHPHPPLTLNPFEYQGSLGVYDPTTGNLLVDETLNHNQIAVCTSGGFAYPCYKGDGSEAKSFTRLMGWWERKGSLPWENYNNSAGNRFRAWNDFSHWSAATPPFPWLFNSEIHYIKAYREWRGETCFILLGHLYCTNLDTVAIGACSAFGTSYCNLFSAMGEPCSSQVISASCQVALTGGLNAGSVDAFCANTLGLAGVILGEPALNACRSAVTATLNGLPDIGLQSLFKNKYADLYRFVPLGDSADKNAGHYVSGFQVKATGQTKFKLLDYEITHVPVLHYGQTQSTVQVSALLNNVHTPLQCDEENAASTPAPRNPGTGQPCCPSGYFYNNDVGSCINNSVTNLCSTFTNSLCTAVNLAFPGRCDSTQVNTACLATAVGGSQDPAFACRAILDSTGLSLVGPIAENACNAAMTVLNVVLSTTVVSQDITCNTGLICTETGLSGVCTPPPPDPLNCKKINGTGTKYEPTSCQFTEVRTNVGDSLTFKDPKSYLYVDDVKTEVDIIDCQNKGALDRFFAPAPEGCSGITWNVCLTDKCQVGKNGCSACPAPGSGVPGMCTSYPDCEAEITVTIPTSPKVPYINQLWKETVVGANTSFRKIFPKLEKGAPVECIKELPGSSPVTYMTNQDTNLVQVSTAGPNTYAISSHPEQRATLDGMLFFPHLGTVYEYFLKGIQTALKPQGYGNGPIPQGNPETCAATSTIGQCKMWLFEPSKGGEFYYDYVIQQAEKTSCGGNTLNPYWAIFFALNENAGLMTDDANGLSKDHFGCDQGGGAGFGLTVEEKDRCMMATLRNDCLAGKTDAQTLEEYGYPPDYGFGTMTILTGGEIPPLWGSNFNTGSNLVSTLLSIDWLKVYPPGPKTTGVFCPNSPDITGPIPPSGH